MTEGAAPCASRLVTARMRSMGGVLETTENQSPTKIIIATNAPLMRLRCAIRTKLATTSSQPDNARASIGAEPSARPAIAGMDARQQSTVAPMIRFDGGKRLAANAKGSATAEPTSVPPKTTSTEMAPSPSALASRRAPHRANRSETANTTSLFVCLAWRAGALPMRPLRFWGKLKMSASDAPAAAARSARAHARRKAAP